MRILLPLIMAFSFRVTADDNVTKLFQTAILQRCSAILGSSKVQERLSQAVMAVAITRLREFRNVSDRHIITSARNLSDPSLAQLTSQGRELLKSILEEDVDWRRILLDIDTQEMVSLVPVLKSPSDHRIKFDEAVRGAKWAEVIEIYERELLQTEKSDIVVRQKFALALTKSKRPFDALIILKKILEENGPDGETFGLIGAVYKTLMANSNDATSRAYFLDEAIAAYRKGMDSDIGNYYPGINLITLLLERVGTNESRMKEDPSDGLKVRIDYDLKEIQRKVPIIREYVELTLRAIHGDQIRLGTSTEKVQTEKENLYWAYLTLMQLELLDSHYLEATIALENAKKQDVPIGWAKSTLTTLEIFGQRIPKFRQTEGYLYQTFMNEFRLYIGEPLKDLGGK